MSAHSSANAQVTDLDRPVAFGDDPVLLTDVVVKVDRRPLVAFAFGVAGLLEFACLLLVGLAFNFTAAT